MATEVTDEASAITRVSQLLAAVEPGLSAPMRAVVKTTVGHLSTCLELQVEQMPLSALIDADHVLTGYLQRRQRYKQSSINSYRKVVRFLLKSAKELGCLSQNAEIPEAWQPIFTAAKEGGCQQIVLYAIRQGILSPSQFSNRNLDRWGEVLIIRKRQRSYVTWLKNHFRAVIRMHGLTQLLPLLSPQRNYPYGIPTESMPPKLQQEIRDILAFKQAMWAPGRPRRARQRPVTASGLEGEFSGLYGFAVRFLGISVGSLQELVSEKVITGFAGWLINERKIFRRSVIQILSSIHAGVRYHPAYTGVDFKWLKELIATIEPEPHSERQERKRRKCLPYAVLELIPGRLRECRNSLSKVKNFAEWTFLLMCELLMEWLITLPWRRRNLSECRIGSEEDGANVFQQPLSTTFEIDITDSVQDELRRNPDKPIWQFKFRAPETKQNRIMWGPLPVQIVRILEEYLPSRCELLAQTGQDHDRLFVNRNGSPLTPDDMTTLVNRLTLQYAGRENSPHLFRSILGYQWLRENPERYPKLTKILGHVDPGWTIREYGSNYDDSSGACEAEAFRSRREAAKASGSPLGDTRIGERNAEIAVDALSPKARQLLGILEKYLGRDEAFEKLSPAAKSRKLSLIANALEDLIAGGPPENKEVAGKPSEVEATRSVKLAACPEQDTEVENAAAPTLDPIQARSASASTVKIAAGTEQKARPKKPAGPKLSRADQGRAARAEGIQRFRRAGNPTPEQFVIVFGERGPRMTWQERAKVAGLPNAEAAAVGFQAALAAKLAGAG